MSGSSPVHMPAANDVPAALFAPDARGFDDGPPLFDFGSLQRGEHLRRHLLARKQHAAERGEPLADGRIVDRIDDRGVELVDDGSGRAFWRPYAAPHRVVEAWQPCLVDARNL